MVPRLLKPLTSNSFFLFGARGAGKTYFLRRYLDKNRTLEINLLDTALFERLSLNPEALAAMISGFQGNLDYVFVDEVQKEPRLLDVVHNLIETKGIKFALSGSSARKLKRGGANLLAGRAFQYYMFPLLSLELGDKFQLELALNWGNLPKLIDFAEEQERETYLRTYVDTYLREEVVQEQLIRNLVPFRRFLDVAAQTSGKIINYSKIARDIGSNNKSVQNYFQILEDTLLGHFLYPYHKSSRKRIKQNPKFYLFDNGVKRAITKSLRLPLREGTYAYGEAFEHFVINEIHACIKYLQPDFECFYLTTADGAELDLIIERPGQPIALIEIKSKTKIHRQDLRHLIRLQQDFSDAQALCLSRDPQPQRIEGISCLPWDQGLRELGLSVTPFSHS